MNKPRRSPETVYNITLDSTIQALGSNPTNDHPKTQQITHWSILNLLRCCSTCPDEKSRPRRTRAGEETNWATDKSLNHYRASDTGSFIDFQRTNSTNQGSSPSLRLNTDASQDPQSSAEELFLLGTATEKIICKLEKIQLRSITRDSGELSVCGISNCIKSGRKGKTQLNSEKKNYPAQEKAGKTTFRLYENSAAELVAGHIGKNFQDSLVVDGYCGHGEYAVQFAKHSNNVVAIEMDSQRISNATIAAKSCGVENNIDFIQADFLAMQKLRADVVFFAPAELKLQEKNIVSTSRSISDLGKMIAHSANIAPNICIRLPYQTQIEEIGELFAQIFDKNHSKLEENYQFAIQIQQICVDDRPECLIVYLGSCSQVYENDTIQFTRKLLKKYEPLESKIQYDKATVKSLVQCLGARVILKYLLAHVQRKEEHTSSKSLLEVIYNNASFDEILFSKLLATLKRDPPLATIFRLAGCSIDSHPAGLRNSIRDTLNMDNGFMPKSDLQLDDDDDELPIARSYCRSITQKMSPNTQGKDLYGGSCIDVNGEVSELMVSSYSLKSAAMLDSEAGSFDTKLIPSCEGSLNGSPYKQPRTLSSLPQNWSLRADTSTPNRPTSKDRHRSDNKKTPRRLKDSRYDTPEHNRNSTRVSPQTQKQPRNITFESEANQIMKMMNVSNDSLGN